MAWKTGRILGPLLFGMMSMALRATGQESVYSADSLMASFEKSSKVSPKGTQITFRDVVVESEDDKVTFKSSHNKRVVCRLVPSSEDHNKPPSVGSDVTVIGKVRGRGLLGNVTLDNCTVAPLAAVFADEHAASLQPDAPGDVSARASDETPAVSSVPAHSEEVTNEYAPTHIPLPSKPGPQTKPSHKPFPPANPNNRGRQPEPVQFPRSVVTEELKEEIETAASRGPSQLNRSCPRHTL